MTYGGTRPALTWTATSSTVIGCLADHRAQLQHGRGQ